MTASLHLWNATIIEMVWTAIGAIGLYFGIRNARESKKNIVALQTMNGHNLKTYRVLRLLAYGHYRNDMFRMAKHSIILFVGLMAMISPPVDNTRHAVTPVGVIVAVGFFAIAVLLALASALDRRQREIMEDMDELGGEDESDAEH